MLILIGYEADMTLVRMAGVELKEMRVRFRFLIRRRCRRMCRAFMWLGRRLRERREDIRCLLRIVMCIRIGFWRL